jgi:hypothetical protein
MTARFLTTVTSEMQPVYAVLLLNGAIRAFNMPTGQAFLPQLVQPEHFSNAVAGLRPFSNRRSSPGPWPAACSTG